MSRMRFRHFMNFWRSSKLLLRLVFSLLLSAPVVVFANSCGGIYGDIPPLTAIESFDNVTSQAMLDEYVRQSNEILRHGLVKIRKLDPAFNESVMSLREAPKPVIVKYGTQKFKARYLEIRINGTKLSGNAESRVATYLRRLARMHPDMRVYLSPIANKSLGTSGFFDDDVKSELALYLDETSVKNFIADQPFDDTIKHETRHLANEDSRRQGLPTTVYDYGLETANGVFASFLEGYEDYISFEEFYSWFRDLMTAVLELRTAKTAGAIAKKMETIETILDSLDDLVVNRKETGIIVARQKLQKANLADIQVRITKKWGVGVSIGDYSLSNTHPSVVAKFKSIAHTTEGKKAVINYFLNDLNVFEKAMVGARKDLPDVRDAFEDLKAYQGTPAQIRRYAIYFEQYVHWINRHFDELRN